jgi:hypothetical protein
MMDPELLTIFKLPFAQQEAFFREKINIPTLKWDDLWKDQHAKGFMVAGAYRDDLLADFHAAVEKAITKGTTLEEFRKDFDSIVAKHGWSYNGSRNWRSEVIYSTNVRQAYNAGRWAQLTDPEQLEALPYLTYKHGDSRVPRPHHLAWDGTTLPADDLWWDTHYPQNGWGCKCRVYGSTQKEFEAAKAAGKGEAPPSPIDPKTGEPVGIDKGFGYNVGQAAFGKSWVQEAGAMKELGPWRKESYPFLPDKMTGEALPVKLGSKISKGNIDVLRAAVPEGSYQDMLGEATNVTQAVADHIIADQNRWDGREQYFPLIPDVIEKAQEVWVGFMQFADSGRVFLRKRYVKAYEVGKGRVVGVLADTVKGQLVAFDIIRSHDLTGGRLRSGRLIYPKE